MNQWAKKTEGTTIVVSTKSKKSRSLLREGQFATLTMTTANKVEGKKEDGSDKLSLETRTNKTVIPGTKSPDVQETTQQKSAPTC